MAASDVAVGPTPRRSAHSAGSARWVNLVSCASHCSSSGIDGTIVNVASPTLVRELPRKSSQLQWIVDAYTIVFAGFLLIVARRRRVAFTTASAPGARRADGRSIF